MGKIKAWYRSVPIWLTVFLFAAAALLLASFVSNKVIDAAHNGMRGIKVGYVVLSPGRSASHEGAYYAVRPNETDAQYEIMPEVGEDAPADVDGGVSYNTQWITISVDPMSEEDSRQYRLLELLTEWAPFVTYSAALLAAALLFYYSKLKKPLAMLLSASAKIAENELDFSLNYSGRDEMAKLCGAFEKMRSALDENNRHMLGMVEERKQLNDAYTHDLRTPIAILKGYTGILAKFLPSGQLPQERVIATINTMAAHVDRLEQFVNSMNTAQKLADLTISREAIKTEDLVTGLRETATLLCEKQNIFCEIISDIKSETLNIDLSAVTQAFQNLLGNALRFAKAKIAVRLESGGQTLTIRVTDDGRGFKEKELATAARPYYSGEQVEKTYHFGLGLHICRTLCEKHGGCLKLENAEGGGARVTAVFDML